MQAVTRVTHPYHYLSVRSFFNFFIILVFRTPLYKRLVSLIYRALIDTWAQYSSPGPKWDSQTSRPLPCHALLDISGPIKLRLKDGSLVVPGFVSQCFYARARQIPQQKVTILNAAVVLSTRWLVPSQASPSGGHASKTVVYQQRGSFTPHKIGGFTSGQQSFP